jgi:hypothetical protein
LILYFQDPNDLYIAMLCGVTEHDGKLYLGASLHKASGTAATFSSVVVVGIFATFQAGTHT